MNRITNKALPALFASLKSARWGILSVVGLLTGACASVEQAQDWIEVPLAENVFFQQTRGISVDQVEVVVTAGSDIEYMLTMNAEDSVSYSWQAQGLDDPENLLTEFHGHTVRASDEPGQLMFYQQGRGSSAEGYLVAPYAGEHGWYFDNGSDSDITIAISLQGFYRLP